MEYVPKDVLYIIFSFVEAETLGISCVVCKRWHQLLSNEVKSSLRVLSSQDIWKVRCKQAHYEPFEGYKRNTKKSWKHQFVLQHRIEKNIRNGFGASNCI